MSQGGSDRRDGFVEVGPRPYLDRLLDEYGLSQAEAEPKIRSRSESLSMFGDAFETTYLVHESLLRSQGDFSCAADAEALNFCQEIVFAMVMMSGVSPAEAVSCINRCWAQPGADDRMPSIWIVGRDIVYHETPECWADRLLSRCGHA